MQKTPKKDIYKSSGIEGHNEMVVDGCQSLNRLLLRNAIWSITTRDFLNLQQNKS